MKILLINPTIKNIIGLELPVLVKQNEGAFPPLGLMYLASYLKKKLNCEIKILDALAEKISYAKIEEHIRFFCPDLVGITAHTHNLIDVLIICDIIKKIDKKIHVCLGGPHVSIFPREAIGISCVDSVIQGEGEQAFSELAASLANKTDLRSVKGIIFKENNQIINTGLRDNCSDLDNLPFPLRESLDFKKYDSILGRSSYMTTMISSRGCPYHCAFCSTPKGNYRMRSAKNIADEIEECINLGIDEIHFVDDTFNASPKRVIEICEEINNRKLKVKWSFRGRIDGITKSLLMAIQKAGCYRIHLGVETSTDEGLQRLNKGITVEQVRSVFKLTHEAGINTVAYFLIGCPHEKTRADTINTIKFAKEIDPDFALFNILTPYPATEIYEEGVKKGVLKHGSWDKFASNPQKDFKPQVWEEWLSKAELFSLLMLTYRKFYIRPKFIFRMLNEKQDLKILLKRLKAGLEIFSGF